MSYHSLAVVGGGQMARALVVGMLAKSVLQSSQIHVVDPSPDCRDWWKANHSDVAVSDDSKSAIDGADAVLLAVKPNIVPHVLAIPSSHWKDKLVISIAAGVPLPKLIEGVGHERVVRVMPNTPSLVGEGASGYCTGASVSDEDIAALEALLGSVGMTIRVTEPQLDAVTGLSGSGPAYVFLMIEALADGGVAAGLPRETALRLASQTVLGAAKMAIDTGQHPGQLKDNVCSPGGTTIAGISVLEQNAVRGALIQAVQTATQRSRDLAN